MPLDVKCLQTIQCQQGAVRAVRFNVDGTYCFSCGADKTLKLWNPRKSLLLKTYGGHGNEVLDACGSCDNGQIASCSADKSVILWNVSTGTPLRRLRAHASRVNCVRYNEESSVIVSGSHDNTVMFWDCRSRKNDPIQVLRDAKDSISSLQVTDHEILVGSLDCHIRRYDLRMAEITSDYVGEPVTYISFTRDGQCMVVSCSDNTVRLFDKDSGELLGEYSGHSSGDYCMESASVERDSYVISGSADGNVWCWGLVGAEVVTKLPHGGKTAVVHSLSPHPTHSYVLTASGATVRLWGFPGAEEMEEDVT
ncbi:WD repeat domain-containing protein 83 [Hetaerina americana]|uniref:WD repeat domain-containing protein 83 n=1 Tax=Hetaerina americana TaxID=62018 RepID=UPI003A7F3BC6